MHQYYFLNLFCVAESQKDTGTFADSYKDKGTTLPDRRSCPNEALYLSTLLPIYLRQFLPDSTEQKASSSGQVQPSRIWKKDATHYLFQLSPFLGWFGRIGMVTWKSKS
jgi:hypothetical protein